MKLTSFACWNRVAEKYGAMKANKAASLLGQVSRWMKEPSCLDWIHLYRASESLPTSVHFGVFRGCTEIFLLHQSTRNAILDHCHMLLKFWRLEFKIRTNVWFANCKKRICFLKDFCRKAKTLGPWHDISLPSLQKRTVKFRQRPEHEDFASTVILGTSNSTCCWAN